MKRALVPEDRLLSCLTARLSSGDFVPALGQFLGSAAGLSAPVITGLTETWKAEQRAFAARNLSGVDYVYCGPMASTWISAWRSRSCACW